RIEADGALSISVSDNGPGIEESRIEDCFAMFGQGHDALTRSVGGLGLGLPLAHRIAELHGGTLAISRGPTGGTVATLRIAASRTILQQPMKSVA
ncbi:MAG: ATP-binding protein, partial [Alphaproteobacteria bacterium]